MPVGRGCRAAGWKAGQPAGRRVGRGPARPEANNWLWHFMHLHGMVIAHNVHHLPTCYDATVRLVPFAATRPTHVCVQVRTYLQQEEPCQLGEAPVGEGGVRKCLARAKERPGSRKGLDQVLSCGGGEVGGERGRRTEGTSQSVATLQFQVHAWFMHEMPEPVCTPWQLAASSAMMHVP